jgi:hypothetical protein
MFGLSQLRLSSEPGRYPRAVSPRKPGRDLPPLIVELLAVVAESISTCTVKPLARWYVTARRTIAVVVENAVGRRFLRLIHGMEARDCWHLRDPPL